MAEEKAAGEAENQDHPAPPWGQQQVEKPAPNAGGSTLKTGVLWAQGPGGAGLTGDGLPCRSRCR